MPDWSFNHLFIKVDTPQQLRSVIQSIAGDSKQEIDFNRVIPEPPELLTVESPNHKNPDEMIKKYGHPDWYMWRNAYWGTKWNARNSGFEIESPTSISAHFDTPYSPPLPVIQKLIEKLSFAYIEFSYEAESNRWGKLTFDNGELIEDIEGEVDCAYRIKNWGDCFPDCESCGTCDCECGCDSRTTQTVCDSCNNNEHENKNNLPEFSIQKNGVMA